MGGLMRSISLKWRILVLIVLLLLPAAMLIVALAGRLLDSRLNEARTATLLLASHGAAAHERVIQEARGLVELAARMPEVMAFEGPACSRLLREHAPRYAWLTLLLVTRADGVPVCSSAEEAPVAIDGRDYFTRTLRTGRFVLSDYVVGRTTGMPAIVASAPVTDGAGTVSGVVSAGIDLRWFDELSARTRAMTGGSAVLVDGTGRVLAWHPASDAPGGADFPGTEFHSPVPSDRQVADGQTVVEGKGADGVWRIGVLTTLEGTGARLFVDYARDEIFGPDERSILGVGVVAIAILTLSGYGAWHAAERQVVAPARRLVCAIRDLSRGIPAPAQALPRCAAPELREALTLFASMAEELRSRGEDLRASEERLRLALLGSREELWDWDLRTGRFLFSGDGKALLGSDEAEPGDREAGWGARIHPDDVDGALAGIIDHLQDRTDFYQHTHRIRRQNGEWRWVLDRGRLIRDEAGAPVRMLGTHADVTDLVEARLEVERQAEVLRSLADEMRSLAEERDHARRAAEAASVAKSRFLAMISHELRTPLHGIMGYSELLDDDAIGEQRRGYVSLQRSAARCLLALVNDILDFSRIEEGRIELEQVPFDLLALMEECRAMILPMAAQKDLQTTIAVDPVTPRRVLGDPMRLRQILMNLLGNAVKFTGTGKVAIGLSVLERSDDRVLLRLEVADTGIGIPEDRLGAIFERFGQAEPGTQRRFGGTGLGLAIARGLARMMGGDIDVRSEPGVGSTFGLVVPFGIAADQPASREGAAPSLPPAAEGLRILVAEDLQINRMLLREVLERAGHTVVEAANGAEVLSIAAGGAFDVVVMDLWMPVMDGIEAVRLLRRTEGDAAGVPVIGLTADGEGVADCLAAGMDAVLRKPAAAADILDAVMRHRRARRTPRAVEEPARNLAELRATLGAENLGVLLAAFVEQAAVVTRELSEAGDDVRQLGELGQTLRGSAGILGFSALVSACASLIVACRADHPLAVRVAVEHVLAELEKAADVARAFSGEDPPAA
ncbi:ATP-binding protein [Arenibaculum pallidiluteum]|uniref:ATP-binding protein n=1 Tax=Arenibaculum pallidiluteum TaxID=2812559 RepID=UPI001A9579AD|nr:ATP-binding protein [Arenibaculum pallidiluteum]